MDFTEQVWNVYGFYKKGLKVGMDFWGTSKNGYWKIIYFGLN